MEKSDKLVGKLFLVVLLAHKLLGRLVRLRGLLLGKEKLYWKSTLLIYKIAFK